MQSALNIVLVKTSSLGDVLHTLPIVSDIYQNVPDSQIDWVVEENFVALPALHPNVRYTIPVAVRRWRKSWISSRNEIRDVFSSLESFHYDIALDLQGLGKSALLTYFIQALRCGYDWGSAREPLASLFYDRTYSVPRNLHAVERNRRLAGLALGYTPEGAPDYGIRAPQLELPWLPDAPYVVLLHATSRDDKLWDERNWIALGNRLHDAGLRAVLPWGNDKEKARSERLAAAIPDAICPPRLDLNQAAALLGHARAVIGVDTGLSHLAAALDVPTIGIYTSTDPGLTGLYAGDRAVNLGGRNQSPSAGEVLSALERAGAHV